MLEPLRVAVVGVGRIPQAAHLPALLRTPETRLVALCDPRPEVLVPACEAYSVPGFASLEDLLRRSDAEALFLCLPIGGHEAAAITTMEAGKHVLVEKPLALTVEGGQRMIDTARKHGRRVMVGYHKRCDAGCERAREWMPRIGPPGYLNYRFGTTSWLAPSSAPLFSASAAPVDTGRWSWPAAASTPELRSFYLLLLDIFSHMTNLLRWLTGERPVMERVRVGTVPSPGGAKADGVTRGIVGLRFGEAPALLVDGPHYAIEHGWNERCELWGREGRLEIDFAPNVLDNAPARTRLWLASTGETQEFDAGWSWAFQRQAAHFARRIRTGESFVSEAEDALVDLEIAEEALDVVIRNT